MAILKNSRRALLAAAASACFVPMAAHAADAAAASEADLPQDQTQAQSGQIADILVTARRVGESAQKTPIAITTLSPDQLDRRSMTTATELAKVTPSLTAVGSSNSSAGLQFSLRGQVATDTAANASSSTGVYQDDIFIGASSIAGSLLDFSDLERIEVLKGPQGTLYGRNVTGGVVKFITAKPTDRLEGYVKAGLGNYDRHYINGVINLPLVEDKVLARLVGTFEEHDGYSHDVRSDRDLDDMHRWSIRGSMLFRPADDLEILLQGFYAKAHDNGTDARTRYIQPGVNAASMNIMVTEGINGLTAASLAPVVLYGAQANTCFTTPASCTLTQPQLNAFLTAFGQATAALPAVQSAVADQFNAPRSQAEQNPLYPGFNRVRLRGGSGTVTYELGDVTLKSITGYVYASNDRGFNVGGGSWIPLFTNQTGKNEQFSQEFQVNGTGLNDRLKYALGYYYLHSKITDNRDQSSRDGAFPFFLGQRGLGLTSGSQSYNTTKLSSTGIYGQATYSLTDSLRLTGGLRYTDESSTVTTHTIQLPNVTTGGLPVCLSPAPNTTATPLANCVPVKSQAGFTNWSYTIGLDYSITPDILIYAKNSRGFKAGGVNAFAGAGAPILGFAPETNTDYEAGIKADLFDRRARINISYYHTKYDNIQRTVAFVFGTGLISTAIQNAASAKIDGVEIETQVKPFGGLTLSGNFAYTNPRYVDYSVPYSGAVTVLKDQSNFPFQGVAKYTYALGAAYELPLGENTVIAEANWSHRSSAGMFENDLLPSTPGGSDFAPADVLTQKGFGLLDLSLTVNIPSLDSTVVVWGKNVLNKRYFASMTSLINSGVGYSYGNFGPPATVGVDWKFRF